MTRRWFTTCQLITTRLVDGAFEPVPASLAHAKEMGTTRSVCGADVSTWNKLWELPFVAHSAGSCPDCSAWVGRQGTR